jgi:hypothetical protein
MAWIENDQGSLLLVRQAAGCGLSFQPASQVLKSLSFREGRTNSTSITSSYTTIRRWHG